MAESREDRPIVRVEDGRAVYRASAAGICRRALCLARLGYSPLPQPDHLLRAAREGRRHEEWMVEDLREEGIAVEGRQTPVAVEYRLLVIEGTVDGFVQIDGRRVLELKSMSRARYALWQRHRFERFPEYAAQAAVYMCATGCGLFFMTKCRDDGRTDRLLLDEPPVPFAAVRQRLVEVESCARRGEVPAEECGPGDFIRAVCGWRYLCGDARPAVADDRELVALAEQWRAARELAEQAEEMLAECRRAFEARLRAAGLEKLVVSGLSLALVRSVRKSVSLEALQKALKKHAPSAREAVLGECVRETSAEYLRVEDLGG